VTTLLLVLFFLLFIDRNICLFVPWGPENAGPENGGTENAGPITYKNKKLSYCWETVRRESMPRIAEMDVEMTT